MQIENDINSNPLYMVYNEVLKKGMFGHPDRKTELIKILLQELESLGYDESVQILEEESMIKLNNTTMKDLKSLLMNGKYLDIINRISELQYNQELEKCALLLLYQQLYVELILDQKVQEALKLLQNELQKHVTDPHQYHKLATLLLCQTQQDFQQKMIFQMDIQTYRKELYQKLLHLDQNDSMSLDKILQRAIQYQVVNCPLHCGTVNFKISLLEDHRCEQLDPPDTLLQKIINFDEEVWIVEISRDMSMIACATKLNSIYIINLDGFKAVSSKIIKEAHLRDINSLQWNRNDTRILSAGSDFVINIFCAKQAQLILKISMHKSIIFTAVYHPLNGHIYSGGVDNWIGIWTENGQFVDFLESKIVRGILFTSDGKLMIVTYTSQFIVNIMDAKQKHPIIATLKETGKVISSKLSEDDQFLLVNVIVNKPELHLWNMKSYQLMYVYSGYVQDKFILNCTFIGLKDYFVAVGSEDGNIYLYHKFNPQHKLTIHSHDLTVNSIQCRQNFMISISDDKSLKLWGLKGSQQFTPYTLEFIIDELNEDESQQ